MPQCIYVPPGRNIINLIVFLLPHYLRTIRPKMCLAAGVFSSQVLVPSTQVWSSSCEVWEVKFSLKGQRRQLKLSFQATGFLTEVEKASEECWHRVVEVAVGLQVFRSHRCHQGCWLSSGKQQCKYNTLPTTTQTALRSVSPTGISSNIWLEYLSCCSGSG